MASIAAYECIFYGDITFIYLRPCTQHNPIDFTTRHSQESKVRKVEQAIWEGTREPVVSDTPAQVSTKCNQN